MRGVRVFGLCSINATRECGQSCTRTRFAKRYASVGSTASSNVSTMIDTFASSHRVSQPADGRRSIADVGRNSRQLDSSAPRAWYQRRAALPMLLGLRSPRCQPTSPTRWQRIQKRPISFRSWHRPTDIILSCGFIPPFGRKRARSAFVNPSLCWQRERS